MTELLGYTATCIFSSMMLPQLYRTIVTRDARGLSPYMLELGIAGNVVALAYAFLIEQTPLLVKYSFALVCLSCCLYAYYRCEER